MSKPTYKISNEFKNDSIYLLVGETVYPVNRHVLLDDSDFFKELFELPQAEGPIGGSSAENPLHIEGIDEEEFKLWLRAMFPRYAGDSDITFDQWMIVLKLLTMWRFTVSVKKVLDRLQTSADPATKIVVCQRYKLDARIWLVPSVLLLVQRPEPLSEDEVIRLGGANTAKIAKIRETNFCCCTKDAPYEKDAEGNMRKKGFCHEHGYGYDSEVTNAFREWIPAEKPRRRAVLGAELA